VHSHFLGCETDCVCTLWDFCLTLCVYKLFNYIYQNYTYLYVAGKCQLCYQGTMTGPCVSEAIMWQINMEVHTGLYSEQLTVIQFQWASWENNKLWPSICTWSHLQSQENFNSPKLIAFTYLD